MISIRRAMAVAILCAVAGCSKGGAGGGPGGGGGFKMPPMPVEVAAVEQTSIAERFEAVGSLEAGEAITVVSEIDGVITELPFREGSHVQQGDVLAQIDATQLRAEVARAEAL